MTYIISYVRVSTPEQRTNGTGFARQAETIENYCQHRGWESQWLVFEDVSGAIDSAYRVALLEAVDRLTAVEDPDKIIVVADSSRWARDLIVGEVLLSKCKEFGIRVWSAAEGIEMTADDPNNPSAVAIRQILAVMAQLDKANIVLRLKAARRIRRASKSLSKTGLGPAGVEGNKPYGMLDGELPILVKMVDMQSSGASYKGIAAYLNQYRKPSRHGKKFSRRVVQKILSNPRSLALVPKELQA